MLFPTLAESAVSPDPIHAQSGCNTARDFSQLGSVYEGATVDPVLYSYQGCNCVSGFLPRYSLDSVGLFHMECGSPPGQSFWLWVGPVKAVVISLLALSWLLLLYGAQLQNERNILRINRLKRRVQGAGTPLDLMGSSGHNRGRCIQGGIPQPHGCSQMHIVTKQVEHRGELEEVTESLWHLLPSGGRCLSAWCTRLPWGKELLSLAATAEGYGPISSQVLFRGLSARLGNACGPVLQPRPNLQTGQARSFSTSRHDITECKHSDRTAGGSQ
ncbi:hypothetical protein WJX79_002694 [Trebouxia sp. C0005]